MGILGWAASRGVRVGPVQLKLAAGGMDCGAKGKIGGGRGGQMREGVGSMVG